MVQYTISIQKKIVAKLGFILNCICVFYTLIYHKCLTGQGHASNRALKFICSPSKRPKMITQILFPVLKIPFSRTFPIRRDLVTVFIWERSGSSSETFVSPFSEVLPLVDPLAAQVLILDDRGVPAPPPETEKMNFNNW